MELKFEWDEEKNAKNKKKHGVSFETAKRIFFDPKRFEALDKKHSFLKSDGKPLAFQV
jgi:uncharacterized DUF497 family protein